MLNNSVTKTITHPLNNLDTIQTYKPTIQNGGAWTTNSLY